MQVSDVKAEIEKSQGPTYPAAGQVIIFQGKVSVFGVSCLHGHLCIHMACSEVCFDYDAN